MQMTLPVLVEHWRMKKSSQSDLRVRESLTARGVGNGLRAVVLILGVQRIPSLQQDDMQVPRSILLH